ncbi:uncharacterized protein DSM5745_05771 [Aspergillus mulundensis]|uniref:Subtilisin-like serine protease n=1 Tax=Aspergillus mulundensis TaxID=1810919 RepID=A0A3D8RXY0_9EURO|nr:Uncharacterized protein DSM5745_05771 [Aspergillus mulundensis]RDW78919.1 Uncharacterized protein DSM5745_05771 [Aspergillus mulundensis]
MRDSLTLPFTEEPFDRTTHSDDLASLLPACYGDALMPPSGAVNFWSPADSITTFIQLDLSVERLTRIQEYLWFAKTLSPPQPLSTIISLSHKIVLDENIATHLVWTDRTHIHLKPFPRYLLDSRFWTAYLLCNATCPSQAQGTQAQPLCPHKPLYKDALGFLFSYLTLVRFESDFRIAQDHALLPPDLTWESWRSIAQQCLQRGAITSTTINPRYTFGALRLSRLDKIYALRYGDVLRGYLGQYKTTTELFRENVAPISAATIYIALVLTAMQVGLATEALSGNQAFQNASYGFTVFAILGPLVVIMAVYVIGAAEVVSTRVFGVLRARRYGRRVGGGDGDGLRAQRDFLREVRGDV